MKDKEQTKRKLITAVAHTFRTEGYGGLGVNKVAKLAGVSKKLIYRYFGGFDRLIGLCDGNGLLDAVFRSITSTNHPN